MRLSSDAVSIPATPSKDQDAASIAVWLPVIGAVTAPALLPWLSPMRRRQGSETILVLDVGRPSLQQLACKHQAIVPFSLLVSHGRALAACTASSLQPLALVDTAIGDADRNVGVARHVCDVVRGISDQARLHLRPSDATWR
jgi:hypothetical protein